jgi:hypothetical protein
VIRVVLVPHDPDSLAAFVLEALTQDLQQQAGDIVPAAGLGKQLVGDQGAHQCIPLLFPIESTSLGGNAVAALPVITVISVAVPRG